MYRCFAALLSLLKKKKCLRHGDCSVEERLSGTNQKGTLSSLVMRTQSSWTELWKEQSFLHYRYLAAGYHCLGFHVHCSVFLDNNF